MGETVWFSLSAVEGDLVIEVFLVTVSVTLALVAVSSASFCGDTINSDTGSLMIVSVTASMSPSVASVVMMSSMHSHESGQQAPSLGGSAVHFSLQLGMIHSLWAHTTSPL